MITTEEKGHLEWLAAIFRGSTYSDFDLVEFHMIIETLLEPHNAKFTDSGIIVWQEVRPCL